MLHEAGYDSFITAWVYQQTMRLKDDLKDRCENMLNANYSFFFINLSCKEDVLNPYVIIGLICSIEILCLKYMCLINMEWMLDKEGRN